MESLITIRPELLSLSGTELNALGPYLAILVGSVIATAFATIRHGVGKYLGFLTTLLALGVSAFLSLGLLGQMPVAVFNRMIVVDDFSNFINLIFIGCGLVTVLSSFRYLDQEELQFPEYNILVLLAIFGMMGMAAATDFIVLFISLELMSLAVYTLVGFRRADRLSNEASLKYFVLGSAASAILLYGAALIYGATGTMNIRGVLDHASLLYSLGAWLVVIGFLFKVASVPFHMWMPDVYEGAPVPVTGFMTTALKAAAFAAFVRVFVSLGYAKGALGGTYEIFWVLALLTMVLGNVVALAQVQLKRMLAYSSIAHTGYLMIGIVTGAGAGRDFSALIIYLVAYALMNLGAFVVLGIWAKKGDAGLTLQDLSGMSKKSPLLSLAMAVFMFSMAGVPPTAGFLAKYVLFYSAVQAGEVFLVVLAVLCSAISVYYYLRVLVCMYMREPAETGAIRVPVWSAVAVVCMVILTLALGLMPAGLLALAKQAVTSL